MILRIFLPLIVTALLSACQATTPFIGVNNQDNYGWSPLHMVASNQYIKDDHESAEMVALIIEKGGNVELTDSLGDTPLVIAVSNNKPLTVEALIKANANINTNAKNARSPLMRSVVLNNSERVKQLLKHEVKLNLATEKGWTALHIASSQLIEENDEATSVIDMLISAGANIEAKNIDQCTPLTLAAMNNKFTMATQLLAVKANINARDKNGWTPLMHAVANGDQKMISLLLNHNADIHISTHEGWSVLHMIASPLASIPDTAKAQIADYLIEKGATVDALNKQGRTPLHFSASTGLVDTLRAFVNAGADIEKRDNYGWTPLMRAVHLTQGYSIDALVSLGAKISSQDNNGWTALHHAASPVREEETPEDKQLRNQTAISIVEQSSNLSTFTQATQENPYVNIIFKLIGYGANLETKTNDKRTPLYLSVRYQELLVAAALLYSGADIDSYTYNEWTPLYRAISQGSVPLVKLLLRFNPSLEHKTPNLGWEALMMTTNDAHDAKDSDQAQIVPLLLQAGSNINATTISGLTACMNATINNKPEVLKVLLANGANIHAENAKDNNKTALDYAIENKHPHIEVFIQQWNAKQ